MGSDFDELDTGRPTDLLIAARVMGLTLAPGDLPAIIIEGITTLVPPYSSDETTAMQAARLMTDRGWDFGLAHGRRHPGTWRCFMEYGPAVRVEAHAGTPALAICRAAYRAILGRVA